MDRPAVDGPDGHGGLRAGERGTVNQGRESGQQTPLKRAGRGGRNQGKPERRRQPRYGPCAGSREGSKAAWAGGGTAGTRAGAGSVHGLTRAQPPPSRPRRGGTGRTLLRLPPRSFNAGMAGARPPRTAGAPRPGGRNSALWGRAPRLNAGQWQEGGRAIP